MSNEKRLKEPFIECFSSSKGIPVVTISDALREHPDFVVIIATIVPELKQEMISICKQASADYVELDIRYLVSQKGETTTNLRSLRLERVDFVKIDVEGFEPKVLWGVNFSRNLKPPYLLKASRISSVKQAAS